MAKAAGGEAGKLSAKARNLWSKMRKSELIEETIKKAQALAPPVLKPGCAMNLRRCTATRRRCADLRQPKSRRSRKSRLAIFPRTCGAASAGFRRAPANRGTSSTLGGIACGTGAYYGGNGWPARLGGAIGAVAIPALGYGAQKIAERSTLNRASFARALAASGAPRAQAMKKSNPLAEALARRTTSGAAIAAPTPLLR